MPLHVHFRCGVALVGEFSTEHCSLRRGTPFQVHARMEISVSMDISILGFYGYIGDISVDIFT